MIVKRKKNGQFVKGNPLGVKFQKGEKHPAWKGDKVSVVGFHMWIGEHFVRKYKCDFCHKIDKNYEFALKKGHKYSRNRNDYFELCKSCHTFYDIKKNTRRNCPAYIFIHLSG